MGARSSPAGLDRWDILLLAAGALAVALFLVAERRIAGAPGLPLDDGWIHLRLARNLATGGGFGINPGEPVAASTAPLWSVVLAGLLVVGVPGLAAAKALGLACGAAAGLVTRRLAGTAGLPPGLAWGAGLAVVTLSRLVWGALSGMEVPLAALCVAAGAWAVAADRPGLGAAGLGLATLARPEAGLLVGLHALGAGRWREALRRAAISAAIVAPAIVFNLIVGGRLVPAPAAAKVEGGLLGRAEGLANAWVVAMHQGIAFLGEWGAVLTRDHLALPALVAVGLVAGRAGRLRWLAAALLLHPVATALVAPYRGPGFQSGRYSSHLLPLAVVVAFIGLDRVLRWLSRPATARRGPGPAPHRPRRAAAGRGHRLRVGCAEHQRHAGGARALGRGPHAAGHARRAQRPRGALVLRRASGDRPGGPRHARDPAVPPTGRGRSAPLPRAGAARNTSSSSRPGFPSSRRGRTCSGR